MVNKVIHGDSLEVLKTLDENSIDSVVTDAPYGLSTHDYNTIIDVFQHWLNGDDTYIPTKKGFMNKEWDAFVPPPAIWKQVFRVMKHGAHILCFAGTRTIDLMSMSLRLAGFEIRDTIIWVYSSGFPKGLDISKGIDKVKGAEREVIGKHPNPAGSKGNTFPLNQECYLTLPATPEAKQWDGWGTALKPSVEPIILARKPLSENTIAENVLKWGTGGLNISGCKVGNEERFNRPAKSKIGTFCCSKGSGIDYKGKITSGRFPANTIFECICDELLVGKEMGSESGYNFELSDNDNPVHITKNIKSGIHYRDKEIIHTNPECPCYMLNQQCKGASRFFYCSKVSKAERTIILENGEKRINNHPTVKPVSLLTYLIRLITPQDGIMLDPFCGSGSTLVACKKEGFKYIGIEREEEYIRIITDRLNSIEPNLFDAIKEGKNNE